MSDERLPDEVEQALAAMKNIPEPHPVHLAARRQGFLAEARQLRAREAVSASPFIRLRKWIDFLQRRKEAHLMMTLAKAALALVLVLGAAGGVAYGADGSLPGQPLYPLDLSLEQAQMALAPTPQSQAQLMLQITSERAAELIAMEQNGNTPDQASLVRLQAQVENCLRNAAQLKAGEMQKLLEQLRTMSQERAAEMAKVGYGEGEQVMIRAQQEAQVGLDDPQGFQNRHRHGAGWQEEPVEEPVVVQDATEPVATDPAVTEDPTEPIKDQDRDRDRDGSCQDTTTTCEPDRDRDRQQDRDRTHATETPTDEATEAIDEWNGGNGQGGDGNGNGGGGQNRNGQN